ncbi:hypothetical protein BaRGS_00003287 [Batillaria attramentaria]|uniref:Uncharacterized protein n=1 Tax=Batillaria attramentaria TaxID=370345 RepID=A0ABD0M2V3_9CAEN
MKLLSLRQNDLAYRLLTVAKARLQLRLSSSWSSLLFQPVNDSDNNRLDPLVAASTGLGPFASTDDAARVQMSHLQDGAALEAHRADTAR